MLEVPGAGCGDAYVGIKTGDRVEGGERECVARPASTTVSGLYLLPGGFSSLALERGGMRAWSIPVIAGILELY